MIFKKKQDVDILMYLDSKANKRIDEMERRINILSNMIFNKKDWHVEEEYIFEFPRTIKTIYLYTINSGKLEKLKVNGDYLYENQNGFLFLSKITNVEIDGKIVTITSITTTTIIKRKWVQKYYKDNTDLKFIEHKKIESEVGK